MPYRSKFKNEETELLFSAILSLETKEDCYRFFEDVCTAGELQAIAQRFRIAKFLSENLTYQEIEKRIPTSTATISRIKRSLKYGADGYKNAIEKLNRRDKNPSNEK
ncbi:MAG: TrpR-like protein YerC/YecD [Clostridiales Family XIII bacterium]|jgi:TrpR-related protein YerC/YecD|nr:TrpR-like protein YerC/YecD [Clostridiales Family XIII bacterium]